MTVLREAELRRIFERDIVREFYGAATGDDHPILILIGAQPGAGKTRAGKLAIAESGNDTVVPIIGDDLRVFHPEYDDLLTRAPAAMPRATAQAAGRWVEMAIEYAAAHRISSLVEGTFRDPATPLSTARRFADAGFAVEVHLVAVAPEESRLSIAGRFVRDEKERRAARFTAVGDHDRAFHALPDTIAALAAVDSPVQRVVVRSRTTVLHDARCDDGALRDVLEAAEAEWARPLSDAEFADRVARFSATSRYLRSAHPGDPDVRELRTQLGIDRDRLETLRSPSR